MRNLAKVTDVKRVRQTLRFQRMTLTDEYHQGSEFGKMTKLVEIRGNDLKGSPEIEIS